MLTLNRKFQNNNFNCWSLGHAKVDVETLALPEPCYVVNTQAIDYIHTRQLVLRNHLLESGDALLCCLSAEQGLSVQRVETDVASGPTVSPLCEQRVDHDMPLVDPALDCSAVMVQHPEGRTSAQELLMSTGCGDLALFASDSAQQSPRVHPLRPAPPLSGVRPFVLEAAFRNKEGELRCVVWAVRPRSADGAPCVEVYLLTLTGGAASLSVSAVQLLKCATSAPHVVLAHADSDSVLLALEPHEMELRVAKPSASTSQPPAATGQEVSSDEGERAQGNGAGTAQAVEAGGQVLEWGGAGGEQDGEDDVSPRTLAQARAALDKFTSQEPTGPLPPMQWSDVYRETGPEDSSTAAESRCELFSFTCHSLASPPPGEEGAAPVWHMSCGAHRLLSAQVTGPHAALLGLADDVDVALVAVTLSDDAAAPAVQHVGFIPALAYVTAGKTQRKHLLLGEPDRQLAAVLVEGQRYLYAYFSTEQRAERGVQQVVDLQLDDDESVLGARIVKLDDNSQAVLILSRRRVVCYQFQ